jgi:O-antigen ligase
MAPQIMRSRIGGRTTAFLKPILLLFALFTTMSVLNSEQGSESVVDLTILQNVILFGLLLIHVRTEPLVLEKGMLSFALGSVATALMFRAGIGVGYDALGRGSIIEDNPNILGLREVMSMTILCLAVVQNRLRLGKWRYLLLGFLPMMIGLLMVTGSRVAVISFALALGTGVAFYRTRTTWRKIGVWGVGALAAVLAWQSLMASDVTVNRLSNTLHERSLAGREVIWAQVLPFVESHPIFGAGRTGYCRFAEATLGSCVSPHNVFLEVACYSGIIGLSIYCLFLGRVFKGAWRSYSASGLPLSLLLLIPALGSALSGQCLTWKVVWCIYAYAASGPMMRRTPDAVARIAAPITARRLVSSME